MEMKACFILALSSSVYSANRPPLLCERLLQISNTQWKVKGLVLITPLSMYYFKMHSCAMTFYLILDVIGLTLLT